MSVYYNDIDPYCCKVLRKNIKNGNLPEGYVDERDIRDVRATDLVGYNHIHLFAGIGGFALGMQWAGVPEWLRVWTGGFPCQDISESGRRTGIEGERSGLWSQYIRLLRESIDCGIRPNFILIENVAALLHRGMSRVLRDLAKSGYDAEWQVLPAEAIGAPHLRERVFIVGYPMRVRCRGQRIQHNPGAFAGKRSQDARTLSNSNGARLAVRKVFGSHARQELAAIKRSCSTGTGQWAAEPTICRLAHGIPFRVEQIRGLGNAIVPQIAAYIGRCILAAVASEEGGA